MCIKHTACEYGIPRCHSELPQLKEAQTISEAVLDAEATKGTGGNRYQQAPIRENDSGVDFSKSKSAVIREAGFTPKQAERFQQLAANPEVVEKAIHERTAMREKCSK